jgi:aminoglycoside phosphotransferase (APT) family kinase protein
VLDCARALGQLHALPAGELDAAFAPHARHKPGANLLSDVIALRDTWTATARDESATIALAFRWLIDRAPAIPPMMSVVHGDYSFHNLLFDGSRLTAVLDWELGHIGHPAEDLGYIQSVASTMVKWDAFMDAYLGAGGPPAAPVTIAFYAMLGTLRLMALMHKARFVFESGLTDDLQLAEVVLFHLPKFVQKLSVELQRALVLAP